MKINEEKKLFFHQDVRYKHRWRQNFIFARSISKDIRFYVALSRNIPLNSELILSSNNLSIFIESPSITSINISIVKAGSSEVDERERETRLVRVAARRVATSTEQPRHVTTEIGVEHGTARAASSVNLSWRAASVGSVSRTFCIGRPVDRTGRRTLDTNASRNRLLRYFEGRGPSDPVSFYRPAKERNAIIDRTKCDSLLSNWSASYW